MGLFYPSLPSKGRRDLAPFSSLSLWKSGWEEHGLILVLVRCVIAGGEKKNLFPAHAN